MFNRRAFFLLFLCAYPFIIESKAEVELDNVEAKSTEVVKDVEAGEVKTPAKTRGKAKKSTPAIIAGLGVAAVASVGVVALVAKFLHNSTEIAPAIIDQNHKDSIHDAKEILCTLLQGKTKNDDEPYDQAVQVMEQHLLKITAVFLSVTAQLRGQGFDNTKDYADPYAQIKHIPAEANLNFVGDIHAEDDALTLIINDWIAKGYLDNDLKATQNNYFIFLGDYVDRGPHPKAVLAVLFTLKCLNPNNVFLMRGNHDDTNCFLGDNTHGFRACFNEQASDDEHCFDMSKAVSQALLPELLLVASDGSIITASHANPPYWDEAFNCLRDGFVQFPLKRYVSILFDHSVQRWNCISGQYFNETVLQPFIDHHLQASFCGNQHIKAGYTTITIESQARILDKIDTENPFICILYGGRDVLHYNNPFCYTRLQTGQSRAAWQLTHHTGQAKPL
ncbi:MAG: Serine/threonine-protein phosphatase [candidate division TM6 bacterium GW2011_GWF2_37_49]|nr:MAG: Serine/threonine-protein phosphatase [candidate division TM6 bacterium GW2011_GWF2_37_49]